MSYPVAVNMSKTSVEVSAISFSPNGVKADWIAGPRTNPKVWNNDNNDTWVVLSSTVVTFEM